MPDPRLVSRQWNRGRLAKFGLGRFIVTMTADDVKETIDTVVVDPAVTSAVESKTVKLV